MSFKYDLTQLKKREQLIDFLGLNETSFDEVLAFDPHAKKSGYLPADKILPLEIPIFLRHEIPKKNGRDYRTVWEPLFLLSEYKALARRLSSFFSHKLETFPHPRTFGYIGGRNIKENAQGHCGHKYLISVDIKDFFPSIKASRIATFLISTGIEPTIADLISKFVSIDGSLPLGLPSSPVISNAICLPMDIELEALAKKHGATFSRSSDDISFSSDSG